MRLNTGISLCFSFIVCGVKFEKKILFKPNHYMDSVDMYANQNELLLSKLRGFYEKDDYKELDRILNILNGESTISLRILDWFVTNYAKQKYVVYDLKEGGGRFKVYNDYKLKLKAYSKKRFDPFCRWDKIMIPYRNNQSIQTTIGQLNFFKWVLENNIIDFIESEYTTIEDDMNTRNSTSKNKVVAENKTRKKREELSVSASKSIKKEVLMVDVGFS